MSKETGGAAFPHKRVSNMYPDQFIYEEGMTLRDYFAGQALTGLCNRADIKKDLIRIDPKELVMKQIAIDCYGMADAMLAERSKT
jgi:hypothetical protein